MKRFVRLISLAAFAAGIAHADPALGGGRGLWRVQDARVEEDGALVFASRWMLTRQKLEERTVYRGPFMGLEMNYAPFPMFEVFGSFSGVLDIRTNPSTMSYDWQGQNLGAKVSFPSLQVLKLAGSAHWMTEKGDYKYRQEYGYNDNLLRSGFSWRAIASLRFWELYKTLPTLMVNYGQNPRKGLHFLGIGVEMASDALDLFVETGSEIPKGGGLGDLWAKTARARVAPGVRVKIPYFHVTGGLELGLTDSVPKYQAILGFNFVSPFPKPPAKPWGRLAGKVVDARTHRPLHAEIRSPNGKFGARRTDEKTGIFYLEKAPTGVVVVEAAAEGYIPEAIPLIINDKEKASHTFELKPLVPSGTVTGHVQDKYTGDPLEATIDFAATDVEPIHSSEQTGFFRADEVPAGLVKARVEKEGYFIEERFVEVEDGGVTKFNIELAALDMKGTFKGKVVDRKSGDPIEAVIRFLDSKRPDLTIDASTGRFTQELPAGDYEVSVEARGYLPQTATFSIGRDDVVERTFELVSKGMVLTLKGVYFEFGKATLRTESYPALTEAAQIMKDNPEVEVEIQGHTDAVGTDEANQKLSEKRAYSVVNFLVQYGGIDPKRLAAKGYGETQPIAPNETDEGRQLNRRVDFVILQ